jgi:hypothetical protein
MMGEHGAEDSSLSFSMPQLTEICPKAGRRHKRDGLQRSLQRRIFVAPTAIYEARRHQNRIGTTPRPNSRGAMSSTGNNSSLSTRRSS